MKLNAPLMAKIAFIGAWLGVLAVVWIYAGFMKLAPEPLSPFSSLWRPLYVTLMGLGVASIVLSLFALDQLGSDERKMAIGGIIGGALVIVGMGLFIWLVSDMMSHLLKF
ncbi:MAG TPA: hypothetical protein VE715_13530 [Blastocatellia bacterium]|jgi:uncharacterized membrane protein YphA (DoxX/SURF4 family)|nr:hypothetical protein [Blastocatellia bacterium]